MSLSLRQRILWWSMASALVIVLAILLVVDQSFRATIRSGLEENVRSGVQFAAELQRSEIQDGVDRTAALATTPTLRAAAETGDPATIEQNLAQLLEASEWRWLAVASPDGAVLATAGPADRERLADAEALIREVRYYNTADLWREGEELYEVHAAGIFIGSNLLAVLLSGDAVGPERIDRLELSGQQRTAFVSEGRLVAGDEDFSPGEREAFVAAWAEQDGSARGAGAAEDGGNSLEPSGPEGMAAPRGFTLDGRQFLGAALPLPGADGLPAGRLVAYRSLDEALAPARQLRLVLLGIVGAGIVLAFVSSFVLARTVTRPVKRLLDETVRLGSGDLEHPVEVERDDEIGKLAEGFEAMRASLLETQEELLRAERLSAVGQAASAIVHDFAQPVNVIQVNADLLKYDWDDEDAREEDLRGIRRALDRLTSMMQEILDFARGEDRIRRTTGSVPDLLEEIADGARAELEGRDVDVVVGHGYDDVWALDFPRTARVVENLVRNAAAAIESGGEICIRSAVADGHLRIEVADDGPGIPDSLQENLFEPFVTRGKADGTGLGLAIARSFTERQGGTIDFETSAAGTTFVLEFPNVEAGEAAEEREPEPPGADEAADRTAEGVER